jgi:hypothetical protein
MRATRLAWEAAIGCQKWAQRIASTKPPLSKKSNILVRLSRERYLCRRRKSPARVEL